MSDDELKREASSLTLQLLACLTASDNGKLVGITEGGATAIGEALRRVHDAATAAERKRCAALLGAEGLKPVEDEWDRGFRAACKMMARAIERQEGE